MIVTPLVTLSFTVNNTRSCGIAIILFGKYFDGGVSLDNNGDWSVERYYLLMQISGLVTLKIHKKKSGYLRGRDGDILIRFEQKFNFLIGPKSRRQIKLSPGTFDFLLENLTFFFFFLQNRSKRPRGQL